MSLCATEELKSKALIDLSTVLILLGVIENSSVVACDTEVGGFCELHACEGVNEQESGELEAVLVGAEHVLVVQKVGTEEEQEAFKVDDLGVLGSVNES